MNDPNIPKPPTAKRSRKRPCGKQSGRTRESAARVSAGDRPVKQRKLNRYYLDQESLRVVAVYPNVVVPEGVRFIEQPAGLPAPGVEAFFDATMLPVGATLTSRYGFGSADLDQALVERLSRLSGLAGVGRQRRSNNLDALACCVDPDAALRAAIVALGGTAALSLPVEQLTADGSSADDVQAAITVGVTAGNTPTTRQAADLPENLKVDERLRNALGDLPGRVVSVSDLDRGSRIHVRCYRKEEADRIVAALRAGGARSATAKLVKREVDGKTERGFIVRGDFNVSSVELAAARAGGTPRLSYRIGDGGVVQAYYSTRLFDMEVTSAAFRSPATSGAVKTLAEHLLTKRSDATAEQEAQRLDLLELGFQMAGILAATRDDVRADDYVWGLTRALGTVTSVADAIERTKGATPSDFIDRDTLARHEERFTFVEIPSLPEDKWPMLVYERGVARANITTLRLADQRIAEMPTTVDGPTGEVPVTVTEVSFIESKGRPRVRVREVPVAQILDRQAAFRDRHEPRRWLLAECRDAVVARGTMAMAYELGEERSDGAAKSRVRNAEFSHYMSRDGAMVLLAESLAQNPEIGETGALWQTWCADQINDRRKRLFRELKKTRDLPEADRPARRAEVISRFESDFWAGLPHSEKEYSSQILMGAVTAMAATKLGEKVSSDLVLELAQELSHEVTSSVEQAYARGRALFVADRDGAVSLL